MNPAVKTHFLLWLTFALTLGASRFASAIAEDTLIASAGATFAAFSGVLVGSSSAELLDTATPGDLEQASLIRGICSITSYIGLWSQIVSTLTFVSPHQVPSEVNVVLNWGGSGVLLIDALTAMLWWVRLSNDAHELNDAEAVVGASFALFLTTSLALASGLMAVLARNVLINHNRVILPQ